MKVNGWQEEGFVFFSLPLIYSLIILERLHYPTQPWISEEDGWMCDWALN